MGIAHLLEDFGTSTLGEPITLSTGSLEDQRLEAFEKGYKAGWDDSVKASAEDLRTVSVDLAQNLQDLSFTYEEAYSAALMGLKPLIEQIVSTLLPGAMQQALGAQVVDQLCDIARDQPRPQVDLVCSPGTAPALGGLLDVCPDVSVSIIENPDLSDGQVSLRFDAEERDIDLGAILEQIRTAVAGFFTENQRETA
jgi:flagellar assembly protein FliH